MMTIREYLQMVLDTEGFEAYEEAEEALIEAYEADDDEIVVFEEECKARGIDTTNIDEINAWVWDWCE